MKQIVNLENTADYKNPFIKVAFKGTFDIYVNGTMIMSVVPEILIKEWGWCAFLHRRGEKARVEGKRKRYCSRDDERIPEQLRPRGRYRLALKEILKGAPKREA